MPERRSFRQQPNEGNLWHEEAKKNIRVSKNARPVTLNAATKSAASVRKRPKNGPGRRLTNRIAAGAKRAAADAARNGTNLLHAKAAEKAAASARSVRPLDVAPPAT